MEPYYSRDGSLRPQVVPDTPLSLSDGVRCCGGIKLTVDWTYLCIEIAARLLLALAALLLYLFKDPFVQRIWPSQWYQYAMPYDPDESFPMSITIVVCVVVPLAVLIFTLIPLNRICRWKRSMIFEEVIFFLLGFSLAVISTVTLSEFIKRFYGRLRPDFVSRCYGSPNPSDWPEPLFTIPEIPNCSNTTNLSASEMQDGRMSFPSEHSGITWAVFLFTGLWLFGKLSLFQNTGAFRLVLPFGLLLLPTAIAITRTSDYRHHVTDVLAGTLFGIVIASIVYIFYWPLSMKPLTADIYAIYELSQHGLIARLRGVPHAKLRVQDPALLQKAQYHQCREAFVKGSRFWNQGPPTSSQIINVNYKDTTAASE